MRHKRHKPGGRSKQDAAKRHIRTVRVVGAGSPPTRPEAPHRACRARVVHGDCREVLAGMAENSVDAVVCDPPYGLTQTSRKGSPRKPGHGPAGRHRIGEASGGFMGKTWDATGITFTPETWRAVLRVLKPGAHLVAFGGTRTHHRMMCAVEDAGFEIRDVLMWEYGSGFPKSHNISKAIDREKGAKRTKKRIPASAANNPKSIRSGHGVEGGDRPYMIKAQEIGYHEVDSDEPATPEAAAWRGWGTALKPAYEPIVLARKPISERSVAANVLRWGTGGINVDGCRIGGKAIQSLPKTRVNKTFRKDDTVVRVQAADNPDEIAAAICAEVEASGRWPANLILSHDSRCVYVGQRRVRSKNAVKTGLDGRTYNAHQEWGLRAKPGPNQGYADQTGHETTELWACVPSCPVRMLDEQSGQKPSSARPGSRGKLYSQRRRVKGAPDSGQHNSMHTDSGTASRFFYTPKATTDERVLGCPPGFRNRHPTVKPLALMRWLVRLVTLPGGTVLDPFAGSGSTLVAAYLEGIESVGVELEAESAACARGRIAAAEKYGEGLTRLRRVRVKRPRQRFTRKRREGDRT